MKINGNTKVCCLVKENKEVIKVIASLNSQSIWRIPLFCRLLAPSFNLEELATKVKCETQFLLNKLGEIGFEIEKEKMSAQNSKKRTNLNAIVDFIENKTVKPLDLILILAQSKESLFDVIEKALINLGSNEVLDAQLDLNPVFLTKLFEKAGFKALTVIIDGKYHVYFKVNISGFQNDPARFLSINQ